MIELGHSPLAWAITITAAMTLALLHLTPYVEPCLYRACGH